MADSEEIACPYCKETIKAGAVKCRHCQSSLSPIAQVIQSNPQHQPTALEQMVMVGNAVSSKMYFHGIALVILSFVTFCMVAVMTDNANVGEGVSGVMFCFFGIPTAIYTLWVYSKAHSSKKMPKVAIFFLIVSAIVAFG